MSEAQPQTIVAKGFNANLAPHAFMRWGQHYYQAFQSFGPPDEFSPVPYFLLCRAIELAIKAMHLRKRSLDAVKNDYRHDILKAYDDLAPEKRTLTVDERRVLREANDIYKRKDFEYFLAQDAATGFSRYPDLSRLDAIARKLLGHDA